MRYIILLVLLMFPGCHPHEDEKVGHKSIQDLPERGPYGGRVMMSTEHAVEYLYNPERGSVQVWILEDDATQLEPSVIPTTDAKIKLAIGADTFSLNSDGDNIQGYLFEHEKLKNADRWLARITVLVTDHGPEPIEHNFKFDYPRYWEMRPKLYQQRLKMGITE